MRQPINQRNNSGIILIVVLWILVIFTLLALGVGRRAGMDLSLTRYGVGRLKADGAAWAGFKYALEKIQEDISNPATAGFDTLYQCGLKLEDDQTPEDIFRHIPVGEGYFDVVFTHKDIDGRRNSYYGLKDEQSKININAITVNNRDILKHLLVLLGYEEELSRSIAASVVDWTDKDSVVTDAPFGAEDDDYMSLGKPIHCKNAPLESLSELLLVKGMTEDILKSIRDYVTLYPAGKQKLVVNVNTAPKIVLQALGRSLIGKVPQITPEDIDSMAVKIVNYRRGDDGVIFTEDDRIIDLNDIREIDFNGAERAIFLNLRSFLAAYSRIFRVQVWGVDKRTSVRSFLTAVVNSKEMTVHYWKKGK